MKTPKSKRKKTFELEVHDVGKVKPTDIRCNCLHEVNKTI